MSLKTAMEIGERGERTMRDLAAANTGERMRFTPIVRNGIPSMNCRNCGEYQSGHIISSSIPFCPEWALREQWGK